MTDIYEADVVSQKLNILQQNDQLINTATFFENAKPWCEYITDVVADVSSMIPHPVVLIVADSYLGDVDGLVRDGQQIVIPKVREKLTQHGNYLQTLPNPPRRVLPALPGESPYHRQRRLAIYNRTHPGKTPKADGALLKGLSKAFIPYQMYLMYKDAQQLWESIKNYPKRDKDGIYRYNKK